MPAHTISQPTSLSSMNVTPDLYRDFHLIDEKRALDSDQCHHHHHGPQHAHGNESNSPNHRGCHYARLRRFLVPAALVALALAALMAYLCYSSDMMGLMSPEGLLKRAADAGTGTDNGQSPFVKNKLYLIVVIVGLVLVVILAIMLSAWCCRGAFENPLCCPCYLCACCGGLACLECIGCGLCAEGIDQM